MKFRPCIDIHNGQVKQIVGSSLVDEGDKAKENFISNKGGDYYASLYKENDLKGGHIILLNPKDSDYYEATKNEGLKALKAYPEGMQIGGGMNADNAKYFLDAGASHVIVTSYVFKDGRLNMDNLQRLVKAVGREKIVLDLSCKRQGEDYYVVTDRWQKMTDMKIDKEGLDYLSDFCDEFLVHAADVEGQKSGIDQSLAEVLGQWDGIPITYAGGIAGINDIELLKKAGNNRLDYTIGSALDLFGGSISFDEIVTLKL